MPLTYRPRFLLLASLILQSWSSLASVGAISSALAGTGRSAIDIGESFVLNPASVSHLRGAAMSFGSMAFQPEDENGSVTDGWRLSLNENSPDSIWGSSIYLSQSQTYRADDRSQVSRQKNDGWFSIGNFVVPQFSAGLSYHLRQTRVAQKNYQEHNFGLGFLWTPTPYLGVGASFQNFRPPPEDLPEELSMGSDSGVGLLYLHSDYLRLRMDYSRKIHRLASLSSSEWAFGLENAMTPWALARIGLAQETSDTRLITQKLAFGLGFAGPRFGIHYAFQQLRLSNRGSEHSVDLTIPF